MTVNGFEFHVYNRTDLYARLQETFGLEPTLTTPKKDEERGREDRKKTLERFDRDTEKGKTIDLKLAKLSSTFSSVCRV